MLAYIIGLCLAATLLTAALAAIIGACLVKELTPLQRWQVFFIGLAFGFVALAVAKFAGV